jgi:hypothetical protein
VHSDDETGDARAPPATPTTIPTTKTMKVASPFSPSGRPLPYNRTDYVSNFAQIWHVCPVQIDDIASSTDKPDFESQPIPRKPKTTVVTLDNKTTDDLHDSSDDDHVALVDLKKKCDQKEYKRESIKCTGSNFPIFVMIETDMIKDSYIYMTRPDTKLLAFILQVVILRPSWVKQFSIYASKQMF